MTTTNPIVILPALERGATAGDIGRFIWRHFGDERLIFAAGDDEFLVAQRSDLAALAGQMKWLQIRRVTIEMPRLSERIRRWLNRMVPNPPLIDSYERGHDQCEYMAAGRVINGCSVIRFTPLTG